MKELNNLIEISQSQRSEEKNKSIQHSRGSVWGGLSARNRTTLKSGINQNLWRGKINEEDNLTTVLPPRILFVVLSLSKLLYRE